MSLLSRTIAAGAAAAVTLAIALPASAQTWMNSGNWRQRDRLTVDSKPPTIWNFTFELRFGGYYPKIDDAFSADPNYACGGPYRCFFGDGPQFYFGLELDWMPVRIPYLGRIGPAFGWGFVTFGGQTHKPNSNDWSKEWRKNTDAVSSETTGMTLIPMHVSAVLRIDEISRRTVIPLVPYAKAGFGFGTWNSGTSSGTSKLNKDDTQIAEGLSFGPHLALGGMLGLNFLDRRSGAMARETTGISQAYLFGEWMLADLSYSAKGSPMHMGTSSWVLGIALDL